MAAYGPHIPQEHTAGEYKRWVELHLSKFKFWQLDSDESENFELHLRNSVALPLVVDDHHANDNGVLLKGTNILVIRAHNASAYALSKLCFPRVFL